MYVVLLAMLALNVEPVGSADGFPMKGNPLFRDSVPVWRILQDNDMRANSMQAIVVPKTNNISAVITATILIIFFFIE